MNKRDFYDWKRHPVTQVVFSQLANRVRECEERLGSSAGINPISDRELVGAIQAYKDVLLIEFEDGDSE